MDQSVNAFKNLTPTDGTCAYLCNYNCVEVCTQNQIGDQKEEKENDN